MDIYEVFNKFQLDLLPNDWVKEIWDNQFSELVDLPPEYVEHLENVPIRQLLNEACSAVKSWLTSTDLGDNCEITTSPGKLSHMSTMYKSRMSEAHSLLYKSRLSDAHSTLAKSCSSTLSAMSTISVGTKSWQTLISNNIQHKPLMCLLSTFIHQGSDSQDENLRQVCLGATNLYFILLAVPGSKVYNIFNPVFYAQAINSLKSCTLLDVEPNSKQGAKNRKRRQNNSDDEESDSDEERRQVAISGSGKINLTKSLNVLLNDFLFSLERFKLKEQEDSLVLTIQILVLITRLEKKISNCLIVSPGHVSVTSLSRNAYIVLKSLCEPNHGDVKETVRLIMRELLPGILVLDQRGMLITPKEASVIKDHTIYFIKSLLLTIEEPAYHGVMTLVQHLCIRVPDRAEPRAKAVQIVYEVMNVLPQNLYSKVVVWIMQLCHNYEVKNRIFGLELVTKLLCSRERQFHVSQIHHSQMDDNESNYEKYITFSSCKFLLSTVLSRCNDASSRVRAKALSIISTLVANNSPCKQEIDCIFIQPYLNVDSVENCEMYEKKFYNMHNFLLNFEESSNKDFDPLPGAKAILELLETYIDDEKVFVRKSALQVLANVFQLNGKWMTEKHLELLVANCRDTSVSVRKMLVQCLTELLDKYPHHPTLPTFWVRGVIPLLADQELKSQEKVLEVVEAIVLKNIVPYQKMSNPHHALPWIILNVIEELKMQKLFNFACHKWIIGNIVKQNLVNTIITHVGTPNNNSAWFVLSTISEYMDIKNHEFVLDYFNEKVHNAPEVDSYCSQLVVETLFLNWKQFSVPEQVDICSGMLASLYSFAVPLPLISRYIDMCNVTTEHIASANEMLKLPSETDKKAKIKKAVKSRVKEWAGKLIDLAEKYLERCIGDNAPTEIDTADEDALCQHIYTLGDVLQLCPRKKLPSLRLLKNLLMSSECGELATENDEDGNTEGRWRGKVGARVSAVAVVTLGKMSLQKEKTAKSLVPLFGKLLSHRSKPEIKINTMISLTDLCTKYTSIVESLLPNMCVCLRDKDLLVRENTLKLLIQLIQEDYLKLRCPIFFHLLYMLQDGNPSIREMLSIFIVNSLLVKQSNIMSQHFVESLFHYNVYKNHSVYSKNVMSPEEREVFSLDGPKNMEKRRYIYRYMLEHMQDDHRFKATYNICTDILAGVADGKIDLDNSGKALLKDALYVLSSKEIRLSQLQSGNKGGDDDEGGDEEINVAQVFTNIAKKTLVSQVVKKNLIENIVPIIIRLKHKLKQLKSDLVKYLMDYLRELMKDYKTEINEILAADKELAAEVKLDLEASEESFEEESGDELLNKHVSTSEAVLEQLMAQAVVRIEKFNSIGHCEKRTSSTETCTLSLPDAAPATDGQEVEKAANEEDNMMVVEQQPSPPSSQEEDTATDTKEGDMMVIEQPDVQEKEETSA